MILRSDFLAGLGAGTVAATSNFPSITPSVTIGVCGPFSGNAKRIGERLEQGVQGALTQSNELAGTFARTFTLRTFDDQNTVAEALLQASFATGDSSIIAMIGHVSSEATLQAISTSGQAGMPLVVPYNTDDRITQTQYRNVFRLPTKDTTEGQLFARTVLAQYKPKLAHVFVQDAEYGADVAAGFLGVCSANKADANYQQFSYDKPDFGAIVDKALAKTPDYIFLAGTVGDMGPIVGVLRAKGYTGPIGASQGFFDPGVSSLGADANGMLVSTSMPYLAVAPSTVRARQEFEQHNGTMDPLAAFGFAAAQLIISAVNRVNAAGRNSIVTALAQGVPIDTMVGTYSFTPFGDAVQPQIYYYTIKDGKFSYAHQAHPSGFSLK